MADDEIKIKTTIDESGLDKGLKNVKNKVNNSANDIGKGTKSTNALKTAFNETGGAASSFASKMESVASGGGAVAAGITAAILAAKKYIETLKQANEAYKVQEKAENALQKAAENNPYLNRESVQRLKDYASEIQSASNFGAEGTIDVMAQLAASGRNESEIMKLVAAAADYAAAKHISLESAVQNLNKSYGGLAGELGELFPEIKELTAEQLKNGEAVDIIASKYKGFAKEAADSSTQAKNSFGDFMESVGKIANPFFEGLNQRAKSFWESMTAQMTSFNDALETASRKMAIGGTKRSVDEGVNLINTEFQDSQTGKIRGAEEVQTKEYLEWLNQELEIRNKINGTLTSEEMQALLLIKGEIRKRNEIEKTAKEEEKAAQAKAEIAVKTKEAQNAADDYAKDSNKKLQASLHALEVEAKAKGEAVSVQDKYNVYLQSYIDLLTKTEGIIKEGYPVEQKRIEQLNELKQQLDEAATAEERLAKATEYTQAITATLDGIKKELTPTQSLNEQIAGYEKLKKQIAEYSDAEIEAAQKGQETILTKQQLIDGLNEAEKVSVKDKVNEIAPLEISVYEQRAQHMQEILDLKKQLDQDEILSEQEKLDAMKQLDDEYLKSRAEEFASRVSEIKSYTDQAISIAQQAAQIMLKAVQDETKAELAELEIKYRKGEISEKEYEDAVLDAKRKGAQEEYKIKMFEWAASLAQATANIAEGVAKAIAQGGLFGILTGALVSAAGAVQIASIISSKPSPPTFSTGGFLVGNSTRGDKIPFQGNAGESILNPAEMRNFMDYANGTASTDGLTIVINNSASNIVNAQPQISREKIEIMIDARVNESLKQGRYNQSLTMAEQSRSGEFYGI